jgi:hypothetical protein
MPEVWLERCSPFLPGGILGFYFCVGGPLAVPLSQLPQSFLSLRTAPAGELVLLGSLCGDFRRQRELAGRNT